LQLHRNKSGDLGEREMLWTHKQQASVL